MQGQELFLHFIKNNRDGPVYKKNQKKKPNIPWLIRGNRLKTQHKNRKRHLTFELLFASNKVHTFTYIDFTFHGIPSKFSNANSNLKDEQYGCEKTLYVSRI